MNCIYCNTLLHDKGFYCPNCSIQVKCKKCSESLLKDANSCVFCGNKINENGLSDSFNTIEYSESETERSFKATFTNTVGQSISESLGIILSNKIGTKKNISHAALNVNNDNLQQFESFAEELRDDNVLSEPVEVQDSNDLPTLMDVKLRDLVKNESDWLLIFVFYSSERGTKEFSREDIIKSYNDIDMYTISRRKNLSKYIKGLVKALFMKSTNETKFILLKEGKEKAIGILTGVIESKSTSKSSSKKNDVKNAGTNPLELKVKKSKGSNSVNFVDLKLNVDEQKSLRKLFETKKPKSQNEHVLVVMKWCKETKRNNEVSIEEINYFLSLVSKAPSALPQVLANMRGQKFRWVMNGSVGKYVLSSIGESFIDNNLPK